MCKEGLSWHFPKMFWTGNSAELCERAAYYGTFIVLGRYLKHVVGLADDTAGWVAGMFGGWIYLVPFFMGALADRIGFRKAAAAKSNRGTAIVNRGGTRVVKRAGVGPDGTVDGGVINVESNISVVDAA